jgi:hypothetical protein
MKTQRERDAEQRRQKLERLQEQIRSGSLTVRQMTPEEREKYAPRPRPERPARPAKRRRR